MSQKRALEHLAACVKRGSNFRWHGQNGLRALRPGADPKLVERAMKIILPWSAAHCLDRLPDEYAPIAWRILATITTAEATFLRSYDPAESPAGLRAGCVWLVGVHQLAGTAARSRVASLCRDQAFAG